VAHVKGSTRSARLPFRFLSIAMIAPIRELVPARPLPVAPPLAAPIGSEQGEDDPSVGDAQSAEEGDPA
jgi:hypothetical protein